MTEVPAQHLLRRSEETRKNCERCVRELQYIRMGHSPAPLLDSASQIEAYKHFTQVRAHFK